MEIGACRFLCSCLRASCQVEWSIEKRVDPFADSMATWHSNTVCGPQNSLDAKAMLNTHGRNFIKLGFSLLPYFRAHANLPSNLLAGLLLMVSYGESFAISYIIVILSKG